MIENAMILAAGFGKRVHPLTLEKPKPLLKIGNETLLSNTLKFLEQSGVKKVVINVHYLKEQIISYIHNNKFNMRINIVEEKDRILDTGGGILNAINYFSKQPFLVINPDTIWNKNYLIELDSMKSFFFQNKKNKCLLLLVDKKKSFDKFFKGDFNLKANLVTRENKDSLKYVYSGLQIINPDIFLGLEKGSFSINKIWNSLIEKKELYGFESNISFLHVSTIDVYKKITNKFKS